MTARFPAHLLVIAAIVVVGSSACDEAPSDTAASDVTFRDGPGQGGPVFNTNVIDTSDVPAIDTTGLPLDGVTLLDVLVEQGGDMVPVTQGTLRAYQGTLLGHANNQLVSGLDFVGSVWKFDVDGTVVKATLVEIETADHAGLYDPLSTLDLRRLDPDRLVYTFKYQDGPNEQVATCEEDATGGARMVIYGGLAVDHTTGAISARDNTIYFGCLSGVVGKVALWGYAPDSPSLPSVSLDEFELTTRIARADYCADGTPNTQVGNELTLRDRFGVHNSFAPVGFVTEALWEVGEGAICLNKIRLTGLPPGGAGFDCGTHTIPACGGLLATAQQWAGGAGEVWTKIP